jgi:hypothetical protein
MRKQISHGGFGVKQIQPSRGDTSSSKGGSSFGSRNRAFGFDNSGMFSHSSDIESNSSSDGSDLVEDLHYDSEGRGQQRKRGENVSATDFARKEQRAVNILKLAVLIVLLSCTIGTAVAIFHYASLNEQSRFEESFQVDAQKLAEAIDARLVRTMGSLDALISSMVSFAAATNQSWPFVTVPDFAIMTSKIRSISSGLIYINHLPLVKPEQRYEWEQYSLLHSDWVNESMQIQESDGLYYGPVVYNYSINGVIHGDFGDVPYNET